MPFTVIARITDLFSEEAMTLPFTTTLHPVAVTMPTLVILTDHRMGTAMETPSPRPFWQEEIIIILHQTK